MSIKSGKRTGAAAFGPAEMRPTNNAGLMRAAKSPNRPAPRS